MDTPPSALRKRICLTPTRNEGWIIREFAAATKIWADHLIVVDQCSTDGTREALQGSDRITVLANDSSEYNEVYRQRLLINKARELASNRVLIALDADEVLSANAKDSKEWDLIAAAPPGTVLRFHWVNILPGFKEAWIPKQLKRCGFIDDGSEHGGQRIHNQRVPGGPDAPVLDLHDIVILHFQYVVWERMRRKHRWYQAWEHCEHRKKGPLAIYREYNHMYGSWEKDEIRPVKAEWLAGFEPFGIDFRSLKCEPVTWWDREVLRMFREHGVSRFKKLAIWDQDWAAVAREAGVGSNEFNDPRGVCEKVIHRLLERTQDSRGTIAARGLEVMLRKLGW